MRTKKSSEMTLRETMKESQLHLSIAELLDWILIPPTFYTTFPAGYGRLSRATAGQLKAKGMKPGMPDIIVFASNDKHFEKRTKVIGLELKVPGRSATAIQSSTHAMLQAVGVRVYICRSQNDVIMALNDAGIEYRYVKIPKGKTNVEIDHDAVGAVGGFGTVFGAG